MAQERLQRALARGGFGSRRSCEELIVAGVVTINGTVATLGDRVDTLTDVVEPFLLQQGFLIRTSSGRRATARAYDHLGVERPRSVSPEQPPLL